jgi:hypothetical protein
MPIFSILFCYIFHLSFSTLPFSPGLLFRPSGRHVSLAPWAPTWSVLGSVLAPAEYPFQLHPPFPAGPPARACCATPSITPGLLPSSHKLPLSVASLPRVASPPTFLLCNFAVSLSYIRRLASPASPLRRFDMQGRSMPLFTGLSAYYLF